MAYNIPRKKEKEEKMTDTFRIAPEEKDTETETFKVEKQEAIDEIQQDLFSEDIPIEIQDENTLNVKAGGQTHKITRKDLAEYQKNYAGTEEGSGSGYRQLGSIGGDWRPIETIASDVTFVFNRLDEKLGTYKTSFGDE